MSKLNQELQTLLDVLEKNGVDTEDKSAILLELFSGDFDDLLYNREDLLKSTGYSHIESDGGWEGEYCYGVIKINYTYLKAEWGYYSYSGYDSDGIENTVRIVTPVQKTITVYQ